MYFPLSLPWSHSSLGASGRGHTSGQGSHLPLLAWVGGTTASEVSGWARSFLVLTDPYLYLFTLQVVAFSAPSQGDEAKGSPETHPSVPPQTPGSLRSAVSPPFRIPV